LDAKLSTLAFYNTENFYSKIKDKESSFLPSNFTKWEDERYDKKVEKIAKTISLIGFKETKELPILVGLSEIENTTVLNDLISSEYLNKGNYDYILYESLDERNINVGCIYRKDLIKIHKSEPIRIVFKNQNNEKSYTRDILFLKTEIDNSIIYFFILHLPSKLDLEINQNKRAILLEKINNRIADLRFLDKDAKIIIMGDFNDSPTADNIRLILNTNPSLYELKENEFFNPMVKLMSYKRGSLIHKKQWMLFDQMLFSYGFKSQKSNIELIKTDIFNESFLTINEGKQGAFPFRTFIGSKYLGGYSDHFPIYTIIKY